MLNLISFLSSNCLEMHLNSFCIETLYCCLLHAVRKVGWYIATYCILSFDFMSTTYLLLKSLFKNQIHFCLWGMWCSTATFQAFAGNRLTIYKDIPALEKNAWINKFYGQMNSTVDYLPKWMVLIDCLLQIQYQVSMPNYLYFRICHFV